MRLRRRGALTAIGAAGATALVGAEPAASAAVKTLHARQLTSEVEAALPPGRLALVDGLRVMLAVPGAPPRQIDTIGGGWFQDPAWSPDGRRLAYARFSFPTRVPRPGEIPWPVVDIALARAGGSQGAAAGLPVVPDSSGLVTERPVPVVRQQSPEQAFLSPAWSPDGEYLFVIRRRALTSGGMDLVTDLLRVTLSTGQIEGVLFLEGDPVEVACGPDGTLAVVSVTPRPPVGTNDTVLSLIEPDGRHTAVTSTASGMASFSLPRFSPSGRRLVFAGASRDALAGQARAPQGMLEALVGRGAVRAHGLPGWPWIFERDSGVLWQAPVPPIDDLAGLAWLSSEVSVLILSSTGLSVLSIEDGAMAPAQGVDGLGATGFAWHSDVAA